MMTTYSILQHYWWFIISLLGALLVFLLFVQGGQSMLYTAKDNLERTMMVNSLGRKWEFTFTTLVTFGGAFFASFPLFYSTSFGGAYWLWMAILFSFIIQAVSYEYRAKRGNIYGTRTFDTFLMINGVAGSVLLGVAVGTFFFGAEFSVAKGNLLDGGTPVISQWATSAHGLEAITDWHNLLLGFTVFFLARTQASLYFMNNISDATLYNRNKKHVLINGAIFVVLFLAFVAVLLTANGYSMTDNKATVVAYKYALNLIEMPVVAIMFVLGVLLVLYGIIRSVTAKYYTYGIWFTGIGTVLVVLALFSLAGLNNTAYYPSLTTPDSSLTIYNSSSSEFTLTAMSWVSILIPFVLGYIVYAWRAMDKKPITAEEMKGNNAKY